MDENEIIVIKTNIETGRVARVIILPLEVYNLTMKKEVEEVNSGDHYDSVYYVINVGDVRQQTKEFMKDLKVITLKNAATDMVSIIDKSINFSELGRFLDHETAKRLREVWLRLQSAVGYNDE